MDSNIIKLVLLTILSEMHSIVGQPSVLIGQYVIRIINIHTIQ